MPTYLGHIISSSVLGLVSVAKIIVCCVIYLQLWNLINPKNWNLLLEHRIWNWWNILIGRLRALTDMYDIEIYAIHSQKSWHALSFHYNHIVSQLYNCVYNWWKLYLSFITFLTPLVKSHLLNIQNVIGKSNIKLSLC